MELKTLLITQARTNSTRLRGKILKQINGKTLLQIHLDRLKKCCAVTDILVATTLNSEDEIIFKNSKKWGLHSFRGSEDDVLDRFYKAAKSFEPDWVVRVTSDCPLLDPALVDEVINFAHNSNVDYVSNVLIEHFPDGQDIEVFTFSTLEKAWKESNKNSEREHVTPYIINNANTNGHKLFKAKNYPCENNYSDIRMTVDEPQDFELIEKLINDLGDDKTWTEYTNYIIENNLTSINKEIIRNEGYLKSLKND